jgi:hypothetical protein
MTLLADTAAAVEATLTSRRDGLVADLQGALSRGQQDNIVEGLLSRIAQVNGAIDALALATA